MNERIYPEERYSIKVLKEEGFSNKEIGRSLDRDKSTIGREIKRNSVDTCKYNNNEAQDKALQRRKNNSKIIKEM